jgi:hypothetical protein
MKQFGEFFQRIAVLFVKTSNKKIWEMKIFPFPNISSDTLMWSIF